MRIYLAGPMRGIPEYNFPAFDRGAKHLAALGHTVFNPADRDRAAGFDVTGMTGHEDLATMGFSLREALQADTEFISLHAEAVALLPGWQKSSGVAAEIALAHALGLPVGDLDSFDEEGPCETLEAPHKPSGTITRDGDPLTAIPENVSNDIGFVIRGGKIPTSRADLLDKLKAGDISPNQARANIFGEVRTTSATGGEKGTKPERYDLIPVGALSTVAALYGRGAAKYAAHNWRKGYEWSKSYAALQRHATQFWNGEDNDPEMGLPHMASVAFHALALLTFMDEQRDFDDRYTGEEATK